MKKSFYAVAFLAIATLMSCSSDDTQSISGTGNIGIEFDNSFKTNDLILNDPNVTSTNEVLHIASVKYIISNIVLTKEDGTTFTYPEAESYFIVDEADELTHVLELENVPAGNYTKVTFGIGINQQHYESGEAAQGNFLASATSAGLYDNWTEGYRNTWLSGSFTSATVATATSFTVQSHKAAANYNYKEVTLSLPTMALVRTDITPEIHVVADVSKIVDGTNKIKLSDFVSGGDANVNSDVTSQQITQNLADMFTVAHVHND